MAGLAGPIRYATIQARIRARVGNMPDTQGWSYIVQAADAEILMQRMRANGLSHWLYEMPLNVSSTSIETTLRQRATDLARLIRSWLPSTWQPLGLWLEVLPQVIIIKKLLQHNQLTDDGQAPHALAELVHLPRDQRRQHLIDSPYAPLFSATGSLESAWLTELYARLPHLTGVEARLAKRLRRIVTDHIDMIRKARAAHPDYTIRQPGHNTSEWLLRAALFDQLRQLMAGDPFHAIFILVYGLLEAIQFERLRAILLAYSWGWSTVDKQITGR